MGTSRYWLPGWEGVEKVEDFDLQRCRFGILSPSGSSGNGGDDGVAGDGGQVVCHRFEDSGLDPTLRLLVHGRPRRQIVG